MAEKNSIAKGNHSELKGKTKGKLPSNLLSIPFIIGAVVVVAAVLFLSSGFLSPTPSVAIDNTAITPTVTNSDTSPTNAELSTQLTKAKFLKEVFTVDRSKYDIFEKAAEYRGESLEDTKSFFSNCCDLDTESSIFANLPSVPFDFAEVAYDLQIGDLYQIGTLGPEYYKQPEFYFNGTETGIVNRALAFKAWQQPQLNYWGEYGFNAYPNSQFDTLSKSDRKKFTATVFVTNGWNIQNYLGVHLVTNSSDADYFDISISEDQTGKPYFLLDPTFPAFGSNWATKVFIEGTVKSNTPIGQYTITLNPVAPPNEISQKWSSEHKGVYAPYGFLAPSNGYITLTINVIE